MKIGELAKLTNIPASTIRFYESKGLLTPTTRSANGYRLYTQQNLEKLQLIKFSQSLGFSLNEIPSLRNENGELNHTIIIERLEEKQKEADILIEQMQKKSQRIGSLVALLNSHWNEGECLPESTLNKLLEAANYE
ncbi:MerR family transcriptional regulator, copper efflux regulator [Pseudoalteromonas sp. BSi20652]|uniref:MerR family transcriptional regulator n=1 Tax=Pseudoalteromonas sp. BSi20652 TaxID=388384 RepID=UPI0002318059|nr:MerR family transcriptional regulator [Pseudoalteromonas sp. BSi20652]GAA58691.1 MerR family transcriptional regulator, copper efflux regulator [Pseudoalteromonas sp. BSi20652]